MVIRKLYFVKITVLLFGFVSFLGAMKEEKLLDKVKTDNVTERTISDETFLEKIKKGDDSVLNGYLKKVDGKILETAITFCEKKSSLKYILQRLIIEQKRRSTCSVCLERLYSDEEKRTESGNFKESEPLFILDCSDTFHQNCIESFAKAEKKKLKTMLHCPLCRQETAISKILTEEEIKRIKHITSLIHEASMGNIDAIKEIIKNSDMIEKEDLEQIFVNNCTENNILGVREIINGIKNGLLPPIGSAAVFSGFMFKVVLENDKFVPVEENKHLAIMHEIIKGMKDGLLQKMSTQELGISFVHTVIFNAFFIMQEIVAGIKEGFLPRISDTIIVDNALSIASKLKYFWIVQEILKGIKDGFLPHPTNGEFIGQALVNVSQSIISETFQEILNGIRDGFLPHPTNGDFIGQALVKVSKFGLSKKVQEILKGIKDGFLPHPTNGDFIGQALEETPFAKSFDTLDAPFNNSLETVQEIIKGIKDGLLPRPTDSNFIDKTLDTALCFEHFDIVLEIINGIKNGFLPKISDKSASDLIGRALIRESEDCVSEEKFLEIMKKIIKEIENCNVIKIKKWRINHVLETAQEKKWSNVIKEIKHISSGNELLF